MSQQAFSYDSYHEYENEAIPGFGRICVRSNVFLPSSELDPRTGMLKPDERPRGRTQALRMEDERLTREYERLKRDVDRHKAEKPGVRMPKRVAIVLCAITAFVLAMVWLAQWGELTMAQKTLNETNDKIAELKAANQIIKDEIAVASDSAMICYRAVQDFGMVAPEDSRAIKLAAVDTRPKRNAAVASAQNAAPTEAAQPTSIPMLASAGD